MDKPKLVLDPSFLADAELDDLGDVEIATPSDGEVLTYDGATALWKNEAPAAGELSWLHYRRSGRYFGSSVLGYSTVLTATLTANRIYALPFYVPVSTTFDRIAINVYTAASGKSVRLGIYDDNGIYPGALVLDAGAVSVAATGAKEITINQTLDPGLYWLVLVSDGTPALYGCALTNCMAPLGGASALWGGSNLVFASLTYDGLPSSFPSGGTLSTGYGMIEMRVA